MMCMKISSFIISTALAYVIIIRIILSSLFLNHIYNSLYIYRWIFKCLDTWFATTNLCLFYWFKFFLTNRTFLNVCQLNVTLYRKLYTYFSGNRIINSLPSFKTLLTLILPPCSFTIILLIVSPTPNPSLSLLLDLSTL